MPVNVPEVSEYPIDVLRVKNRIIFIRVPENTSREARMEIVDKLLRPLKDHGALFGAVIPEGVKVESLTDKELYKIGLKRIKNR